MIYPSQESDILYSCSLKAKEQIFWWDSLPASFNFNDSVSTCKLPILPLLAAFSKAFSTLMALPVSPLASHSPLSTITTISATNSPKLLLKKINQSRIWIWIENCKIAKIWIMFLFYVLSFFKKGDTIQEGILSKEIGYWKFF